MSGHGPLNPYVLQVGAPGRKKLSKQERTRAVENMKQTTAQKVKEAQEQARIEAAVKAQVESEAQAAQGTPAAKNSTQNPEDEVNGIKSRADDDDNDEMPRNASVARSTPAVAPETTTPAAKNSRENPQDDVDWMESRVDDDDDDEMPRNASVVRSTPAVVPETTTPVIAPETLKGEEVKHWIQQYWKLNIDDTTQILYLDQQKLKQLQELETRYKKQADDKDKHYRHLLALKPKSKKDKNSQTVKLNKCQKELTEVQEKYSKTGAQIVNVETQIVILEERLKSLKKKIKQKQTQNAQDDDNVNPYAILNSDTDDSDETEDSEETDEMKAERLKKEETRIADILKNIQEKQTSKQERLNQQAALIKQKEEYERNKLTNQYKPQHLQLDEDLQVFKKLVNFCKNLAVQSKGILYSIMQQFLRRTDMEPDLWKLGTSAVALSQNNGLPMTSQQISHQLIRSFFHMHDVSLQTVIYAYMRYHYGLISECEAFTALVYAVQHEIKYYFHLSEVWDIAILRELFKEYNINAYNQQTSVDEQSQQETDKNTEPQISTDEMWDKNQLLMGIHAGLIALGPLVILIEWLGDWKTFLKTWKYEKGPLFPVLQHLTGMNVCTTKIKIFRYSFQDNDECFGCMSCNSIFPSNLLYSKHRQQCCLGKGEEADFITSFEQEDETLDEELEEDKQKSDAPVNANQDLEEVEPVNEDLEEDELANERDSGGWKQVTKRGIGYSTKKNAKISQFYNVFESNRICNRKFQVDDKVFEIRKGVLWFNNLQELKFLNSTKSWKKIDRDDKFDYDRKDRTYKTITKSGDTYVQVGVDKKHCLDFVISHIKTIQDKLQQKQLSIVQFEKYLESYQTELLTQKNKALKKDLSLEQMRNFARCENQINNLLKSIRSLPNKESISVEEFDQQQNISETPISRQNYLPLDPRRILISTNIYPSLFEQRKNDHQMNNEQFDQYEDDLEFYSVTVFANFTENEIRKIMDDSVTKESRTRIETLHKKRPVNAQNFTYSPYSNANSLSRLKKVLQTFEDFGMITWDKPSFGYSLPEQILKKNVKLSPVFILMWNAWMKDLDIEENLMLISTIESELNNHLLGNTIMYENIQPNLQKDILVQKIEDEYNELQSDFGGLQDSTTHMWQATPTLNELKTYTMAQLKQRLLQCLEVVGAIIGTDYRVRLFCEQVWKSLYPWEDDKRDKIVQFIFDRKFLHEEVKNFLHETMYVSSATKIQPAVNEYMNIDMFENYALGRNGVELVRWMPVVTNNFTMTAFDQNTQVYQYLTNSNKRASAIDLETLNVKWWSDDLKTLHDRHKLTFCKNLWLNWIKNGNLHLEGQEMYTDGFYRLYMYLMLLKLRMIKFDGRCEFGNNTFIIQQVPTQQKTTMEHLISLLKNAKTASQKRLDKLAYHLKYENLEPYTVIDMNIILEVGADIWINFMNEQETTKKDLSVIKQSSNNIEETMLNFSNMVEQDVKHMKKFRSETRYEDEPNHNIQSDVRTSRGKSKSKKKDTFQNQQKGRDNTRKGARDAKREALHATGAYNSYCIRLTSAMNIQRGRTLKRLADSYGEDSSGVK